jgi:hypothetical protein
MCSGRTKPSEARIGEHASSDLVIVVNPNMHQANQFGMSFDSMRNYTQPNIQPAIVPQALGVPLLPANCSRNFKRDVEKFSPCLDVLEAFSNHA